MSPGIYDFRRIVIIYGTCGSSDDDNDATDIMNGWKRALIGSDNTVEFVRVVPTDPPKTNTNPLRTKMRYGCHHTKMFLVGYDDYCSDGDDDAA